MQIDDDTLMALADGELTPERAAAVQRAVDADPDLQGRLHRFVESRRLLAGLKPAPTGAEDPLAAMIRAAATPAKTPEAAAAVGSAAAKPAEAVGSAGAKPEAEAEPAEAVGSAARVRSATATTPAASVIPPASANLNRRPLLALAASVAVLAIVGLGWWQGFSPAPKGLAAPEVAALEQLHSGEVRGLENGTQLSMIASFRASEGQLCREYETIAGDEVRNVLACRGTQGWEQRFAAISRTKEGTFQPASDASSIDAALEAVGAGAPLSPADEAAAMGSAAGAPPTR